VLALLIAGAALNVAVAWGCGFVDRNLTRNGIVGLSPLKENEHTNGTWEVSVTESRFVLDVRSTRYRLTVPPNSLGERPFNNFPQATIVLPARFGHLAVPSTEFAAHSVNTEIINCIAVGWPMLTLWHERETRADDWTRYVNVRSIVRGAVNLRDLGAFPYRPIWPGFAINTLFYAGVLWVLCCGPFALRRMIRRRRGLCAACAYPIGQSDVCTECGALHSHAAMKIT